MSYDKQQICKKAIKEADLSNKKYNHGIVEKTVRLQSYLPMKFQKLRKL